MWHGAAVSQSCLRGGDEVMVGQCVEMWQGYGAGPGGRLATGMAFLGMQCSALQLMLCPQKFKSVAKSQHQAHSGQVGIKMVTPAPYGVYPNLYCFNFHVLQNVPHQLPCTAMCTARPAPWPQGDCAMLEMRMTQAGSKLPLPGLTSPRFAFDTETDPLGMFPVSDVCVGGSTLFCAATCVAGCWSISICMCDGGMCYVSVCVLPPCVTTRV